MYVSKELLLSFTLMTINQSMLQYIQNKKVIRYLSVSLSLSLN